MESKLEDPGLFLAGDEALMGVGRRRKEEGEEGRKRREEGDERRRIWTDPQTV